MLNPVERISRQSENPFASLIPDQQITIIPSFTLESGTTLVNVPVAYTTKGKLSPTGDNALVICHALSGSADVGDWWGPLLGGPGKAFDTTRFFIVCLNSLGSPYGTASPVTNIDGDAAKGRYGPEFPLTTIRDDVRLHKLILDDLKVRQIAAAVGGSMGGMLVLEYAYLGKDYVRSIVPIATSSQHSAWGISWGEAQRQSIYADPKYLDGYYSFDDPPSTGLGAARMQALLTYRSRNSFESRFGRNVPDPSKAQKINDYQQDAARSNEHFAIHNDGHRASSTGHTSGNRSPASIHPSEAGNAIITSKSTNTSGDVKPFTDPQFHGTTPFTPPPVSSLQPPDRKRASGTFFSAQSYLRYQGQKFVKRFDSNCYIAITRKLDTHDVSKHCKKGEGLEGRDPLAAALSQIEQPTLVIGIESDGLFTFAEQEEIAANVRDSRLRKIDSPEGHDAFLLQFEQVNSHIMEFFNETLPDLMHAPPLSDPNPDPGGAKERGGGEDGEALKDSVFGEVEIRDITAW